MDRRRSALFTLMLLPMTVSTAQAYIDPASGSLVLQLLSGVLVGILFFIRRIRETVTGLLQKLLAPFRKKS